MTTMLQVGTVIKASEFTARNVFISIDAKVVGCVVEALVGPAGYVTRWTKDGVVTEQGDVKAWRDGP